MEDKTKKIKERPWADMIFRLACIYLAATFFFNGLQDWRNEEYLKAGMEFSGVIMELSLVFRLFTYESKLIKSIPIIAVALCFIFFLLWKFL